MKLIGARGLKRTWLVGGGDVAGQLLAAGPDRRADPDARAVARRRGPGARRRRVPATALRPERDGALRRRRRAAALRTLPASGRKERTKRSCRQSHHVLGFRQRRSHRPVAHCGACWRRPRLGCGRRSSICRDRMDDHRSRDTRRSGERGIRHQRRRPDRRVERRPWLRPAEQASAAGRRSRQRHQRARPGDRVLLRGRPAAGLRLGTRQAARTREPRRQLSQEHAGRDQRTRPRRRLGRGHGELLAQPDACLGRVALARLCESAVGRTRFASGGDQQSGPGGRESRVGPGVPLAQGPDAKPRRPLEPGRKPSHRDE